MIVKYSRNGAELARFATEEEAAKDGKFTLPLLRSHLNAKKPKYLDGCVYKVEATMPQVEAIPASDVPGTVTTEDVASVMDAWSPRSGNTLTEGLTPEAQQEILDIPMQQLGELNKSLYSEEQLASLSLTDEQREELRKLQQDAAELGLAVYHTDAEGAVTLIDPLSEEGQQVLDLRDAASRALNPSDPTGSIPDDFHLTPMEKRRREQNATPLQK